MTTEAEARRELLGSCWLHVPPALDRLARWGIDWDSVATSFTRLRGGRALSTVSAIPFPLRLDGETRRGLLLHAGATRASHRGRGLFREVFEEALASPVAQDAVLLLQTDTPALYERFGFVAVPEHDALVHLEANHDAPTPPRRLWLDAPDDRALVRRLLAERAPVSDRVASLDSGALFLYALALDGALAPTLLHLPALDALVAVETAPDRVRVLDLAARSIPTVAELSAHLGRRTKTLEFGFDVSAILDEAPTLVRAERATLMVRARTELPRPLCLSPLARC